MKEEATYKTLKDIMSGEKNSTLNFNSMTPNKLADKFSNSSNFYIYEKKWIVKY